MEYKWENMENEIHSKNKSQHKLNTVNYSEWMAIDTFLLCQSVELLESSLHCISAGRLKLLEILNKQTEHTNITIIQNHKHFYIQKV